MAYSLAHPWAWSPSAATRLSTHRHLVNCYYPCLLLCYCGATLFASSAAWCCLVYRSAFWTTNG